LCTDSSYSDYHCRPRFHCVFYLLSRQSLTLPLAASVLLLLLQLRLLPSILLLHPLKLSSFTNYYLSILSALSPFVHPSFYQSSSNILALYSRLHGLLNFRSRRSRRPGSSSSADTSDSTLTANSDYEITPADSTSYSPEVSPRSSTSSTSTSSSTSKQHRMPFRQRMARHFGDSVCNPASPYACLGIDPMRLSLRCAFGRV
jgi:hypothetical protein